MADYTLSPVALLKLLMHALKYPHATVNGVLLADKPIDFVTSSKGSFRQASRDSQESGSGPPSTPPGKTLIVDAIPLFHSGHGLTPMVEVALIQVTAYCKSKDLSIVGYYQANENIHFCEPDCFAIRLADKIWEENQGEAFLVMVNTYGLAGTLLENSPPEAILNLYACSGNENKREWKKKGDRSPGIKVLTPNRTRVALVEHILPSQDHYGIVDFDDHLNDVANDWKNPKVTKRILNLIETLSDADEGNNRLASGDTKNAFGELQSKGTDEEQENEEEEDGDEQSSQASGVE